LKRSDNDVIWNGNANTPNQFPCTVAGNCDHGMRWAVCRSVWYEVTEDACADDLFISSAEDCEAAANALDIQWNSCCQNNDNLPYGCLKRSDNDVIWNGNANTPNRFPCTVAGNCDHGMRWAVCAKGDDSIFESEAHKTCCLDGWDQGTDCQHGCWGCTCSDGTSQCGCVHLDNVDEADYYPPTGLGDADAAVFGFEYEPEQLPWTVTLSGKDLLILLLVAINMVSIVAVCCVCARTKGSRNGTTKYKVVRMVGDSEMDSEEIALQR